MKLTVFAAPACCLVLAGCTAPVSVGHDRTPSAPASSTPVAAASDPTVVGAPPAGGALTPAPESLGEPFTTVELGCQPGTPFTKVSFDVYPIQRRGKLAFGILVARGTANPAAANRNNNAYFTCNATSLDFHLIDGANLVSYSPVAGAGYSTPNSAFTMISAAPTTFVIPFPAPDAGVTSADLVIGPGGATGVPFK